MSKNAPATARKNKIRFLTLTMAGGLLATTSLVHPGTAATPPSGIKTTVFESQSPWSVNKIDNVAGGYCSMAQLYNDNVVLNVAQNRKKEISLAVDFRKPNTFDPAKSYKVLFQIGNEKPQSHTIKASSSQALVIGLGPDQTFIDNLKAGAPVTIAIEGEAFKFTPARSAEGLNEIATCLAGFEKPATTQPPQKQAAAMAAVTPAAGSPPVNEAAKPVPPASPVTELDMLRIENTKLKEALSQTRQSFENKTMGSSDSAAVAELSEKISLLETQNAQLKSMAGGAAPASAPEAKPDPAAAAQMKAMQEENAKLKAALDAANAQADQIRATAAKQQPGSASPDIAKLSDELAKLRVERDAVQKELQAAKEAATKSAAAKPEAATASGDALAGIQAENSDLKRALQKATDDVNKLQQALREKGTTTAAAAPADKGAIQADIAAVTAERDQLKADLARMSITIADNQQKIARLETESNAKRAQIVPLPTAPLENEIAKLRAENEKLQNELVTAKQQSIVSADAAKAAADGKAPAPVNAAEIQSLREQLESLQAQNDVLLDQVNSQPKTQNASADIPGGTAESEPLRKQVRTLRGELDMMSAENQTLKKQLNDVQNKDDKKQIQLASDNWDLEQATRRYQESQREIRRLGAMLQQEKSQCEQQKKEIEYMLFDPSVASSAQIAMLGSLEDELNTTKDRIRELEKQYGVAQTVSADASATIKAAPVTPVSKENDSLAAIAPAAGDPKEKIVETKISSIETRETGAAVIQDKNAPTVAAVPVPAPAPKPVEAKSLLSAVSRVIEKVSPPKVMAPQPVPVQKMEVATVDTAKTSKPVEIPVPAPVAVAAPVQIAPPVPAPMPVVAAAVPAPQPIAPPPVAQKPAPQPQMVAAAPVPAMNVFQTNVAFKSPQDFNSMLRAAQIGMRGDVRRVENVGNSDFVAYRWDTGTLFGSAEQRVMTNRGNFSPAVDQYLTRAKSRCKGDFAAVPALASPSSARMDQAGYEIACVGGSGGGSSASLLFTWSNGVFTTIAHEGRADAMDMAMDARDRVQGAMVDGQTAMR